MSALYIRRSKGKEKWGQFIDRFMLAIDITINNDSFIVNKKLFSQMIKKIDVVNHTTKDFRQTNLLSIISQSLFGRVGMKIADARRLFSCAFALCQEQMNVIRYEKPVHEALPNGSLLFSSLFLLLLLWFPSLLFSCIVWNLNEYYSRNFILFIFRIRTRIRFDVRQTEWICLKMSSLWCSPRFRCLKKCL